jgi:hypothetical protein
MKAQLKELGLHCESVFKILSDIIVIIKLCEMRSLSLRVKFSAYT